MHQQIASEASAVYTAANEDDILAAAERILAARFKRQGTIADPMQATDYFRARLAHLSHEEFHCMFLDTRYRIIACEAVFRGTLAGAAVYPRELVKLSLAHNAAAVILAHNHPSGDSTPSTADVDITRKLMDALALVDVRVLDHLVIGTSTTSLAARGLM